MVFCNIQNYGNGLEGRGSVRTQFQAKSLPQRIVLYDTVLKYRIIKNKNSIIKLD